jgi:hypothetical protein
MGAARRANYPHSFINPNYNGRRLATPLEINCKLILNVVRAVHTIGVLYVLTVHIHTSTT